MTEKKGAVIKGIILKVKDIMTKGVKTIAYNKSIKEAAENMLKEKVSLLLVVDGSNKPIGVVTRKDIAFRVIRKSESPEDVMVAVIMSAPVSTINENLSAVELGKFFGEKKYKRLLVENDNGELAGIVSTTDMLKAVANNKI
ncbi:MAG: CBS domain-containing protein [Candidatus Altiarchaeum hamiconexum]|uniref:CBS domain-containing protein n=1 Tax=Candidatus Altarchaeum hamiconexum TaxID=1803513 RepID=A0A8J8CGH0_9ARCH|nr:CBS domain-containing protein [Candidatus Altarchaeum hamiconexum]OIQ05827.1 MAG: hypothetical protein AUK59_02315 [Candidatus Altarchaeum sp. CG2_30_32_3053]PIN67205.1 MAG: hypothetical protein COV98_04145 [Candidatus Altarchaeum sp. CG12_big_fil_rev_8_21_14_0_65_33_22]PIV28138.1 MAG: hypothetical protein COS36_03255 [Candidatus Altarchaeum sp. CG03_land_8_20_14_0_80_32_618]PIX48594.1 MAG: hypothetical protein COZ53_03505 [Candidatus Altarchaeum sp. CG_4_8_14_3_um_filter_33_2054]PIZ31049.1